MTTTDSPFYAMEANADNTTMGLELGHCLLIESTLPGLPGELFFYDPQVDDTRDLEVGFQVASGERYEELVGMVVAHKERVAAWCYEHGPMAP